MKKTRIITLILMIIALAATSCLAEVVYEGEVKDNEKFYIDGVEHVAKFYPSAGKLSISAGEERLLIPKGDCEDNGAMQYCVESAETGYHEETGEPISTVSLKVSEFGPEIDVDRDISDTSPMINSEVTVTTTLTNIGTERANSVNYEDKYPDEVKVKGSVADKIFNQASWSGNIDPGDSETFTYTLEFTDFKDFTSKAKVKYPAKDEIKTKYSEEEEFMVERPYEFSSNMTRTSFGQEEEIPYTVRIKNQGTETSEVDLEIKLPNGFTVAHRDVDLKGTPPTMTYQGEIAAEEEKTLTVRVKTTEKGEHEITSDLELSSTSYDFEDSISDKFSVGISDIVATINLTPEEVKAGSEYMIEAKVTNKGSDTVTISALDFTSNKSDPRGWRSFQIEPGKSFKALDRIMYAPVLYEKKDYHWKLKGYYKSAGGKRFDFEETGVLTVLPYEEIVKFTEDHYLVNETEGHRYMNITLMIKNVKDYTLTELDVIDGLPKGFGQVGGKRYYEGEKLEPGEEILAYSYIVKLPKEYEGESFEVVHTFNAVDPDGEKLIFELPTQIDLEKTEPSEEMTEKMEEIKGNESEETGTDKEEQEAGKEEAEEEKEKPGIFKRMWNWIKGLFGGEEGEKGHKNGEEAETDKEESIKEVETEKEGEEKSEQVT